MNLEELNTLTHGEASDKFSICCSASKWVEQMIGCRPFQNKDKLFELAEKTWFALTRNDWLEAFSHHPKIGDTEALQKKFQRTQPWTKNEQAGVKGVSEDALKGLAAGNRLYKDKFGYIFIVCATGKSADEMLALLKERLENDPEAELLIAAKEQNKITRLRLEKLFNQ